MADRTFATLTPRLTGHAQGIPYPLALDAVRQAATRACERTLVWRYVVPEFALTPGVPEYAYNVPANARVHAVFEALLNDRPLERLSLEQAICKHPQWADLYSGLTAGDAWAGTPESGLNTEEFNTDEFNDGDAYVVPAAIVADGGTPVTLTQTHPNRYTVLPLPDGEQTYNLRMFVALKPTPTADGMDEHIFDELEEVILHGALQHILAMPQKQWTDREGSEYHARQYTFQVTERRARANLGNARATLTAQFPRFGA